MASVVTAGRPGAIDLEVGSERSGTMSFLTIAPGAMGFELVVGARLERRLTTRDAQNEHVFTER